MHAPVLKPPRAAILKTGIGLIVLCLAGWALYHQIGHMRVADVKEALHTIHDRQIGLSVLATCVSFLLLGFHDILATRILGLDIPLKTAAFAGAASNAVANTLGFHALTGGALRYRIYQAQKLSAGDVARIFALTNVGIGLGFFCIVTLALSLSPALLNGWGRLAGGCMMLAMILLLGWLSGTPRHFTLYKWQIVFPARKHALLFMAIGTTEMFAAIAALYILLPSSASFGFLGFSVLYIGAVLLGVVSSVPGGLGIFETAILVAFPAPARTGLVAALLVYRVIYNLLPFALAAIATLICELRRSGMQRNQLESG